MVAIQPRSASLEDIEVGVANTKQEYRAFLAEQATGSNLVTTQLIGDDLVIFLGDRTLVQSKSHPGSWRVVDRNVCECPCFHARGKCRHVVAALTVEEMDRETAEPLEPDMIWAGWHTGWIAR